MADNLLLKGAKPEIFPFLLPVTHSYPTFSYLSVSKLSFGGGGGQTLAEHTKSFAYTPVALVPKCKVARRARGQASREILIFTSSEHCKRC